MATEVKPATDKQIGFLKRLVGEKNILADIDYGSLSSLEAHKMIDRIQKQPKGNNSDGYPVVRSNPAIDEKSLGQAVGMAFKLAWDANHDPETGDILARDEDRFKQVVARLVRLSLETQDLVRVALANKEAGL